MPFKTETSSAKSEWGQWASFSLGLGKLQGYKGRVPSLSPRNVEPPKERTDWAKIAIGVKARFDQWSEQHDNESAKDVEKYLASHSTEELKTLMKERQIPFQDDPWAMAHFNNKMGQIHSGIAEGQFQQNIQNGLYDSLSPEQLDAEHYNFMNQYLQGVKDNTNGFFDGDVQSKQFQDGFFSLSPKQRLVSIANQQKRQDQILTEKSQLADLGRITAYLDSNDATVDGLVGILKDQEVTGGYHKTPAEIQKQYNEIFKYLPKLGDKGVRFIEELRNKRLEGLGGLTGEEFYSKDGLDTLKIKALNIQYGSNMLQKSNFERELQRLARDGSNASKMVLLKELDTENKLSGGKETDKGKAIVDALRLHEVIKAKNHADARANYDNSLKMGSLQEWMKGYLNGAPVEDYKEFLRKNKINDIDTIGVWNKLVEGAIASGNPTDLAKVLNCASLKGAPANLTRSIKTLFTNLYNRELTEAIDSYRRGEGIPVATDENGNELPRYSYTPIGSTTNVDATALPLSMRTLMTAFRADSSAMKTILNNGDTRGLYDDLCIIDTALKDGKNPIKYLGDVKEAESRMTTEDKNNFNKSTQVLSDNISKISLGEITEGYSPNLQARSVYGVKVKARAEELYRANLGKKNFNECLTNASTEVASQHVLVGSAMIPKRDISQAFLGLNSVAGINTDFDREFSNRVPYLKTALANYLKDSGFTDPNSYAYSYYDERTRSIVIVDSDFIRRGEIPIDQVSSTADALYIKGEKERMTTSEEEFNPYDLE